MGLYGKIKKKAKKVGKGIGNVAEGVYKKTPISGILDTTDALRGARNEYRRNPRSSRYRR